MTKTSLIKDSVQAKPLLKKSSMKELVDPTLGDAYNTEQLTRLLLIASACINQTSACRPQMSKACSFMLQKALWLDFELKTIMPIPDNSNNLAGFLQHKNGWSNNKRDNFDDLMQVVQALKGDEEALAQIIEENQSLRRLQRTFSEEFFDAEEFNSASLNELDVNDINRHMEIVLGEDTDSLNEN